MKDEYLAQLEETLRKVHLKEEIRKEIIEGCKEHIRQSMLQGKSEEEAYQELVEPIGTASDSKSKKEMAQTMGKSGGKFSCGIVVSCIRKAIGRGMVLIGAFFVELWILLAQIIALLITCSGILCLSGLVIPYVREHWVRMDIVTSFPMKIFCMLLGGIFFSGAGFMWFLGMAKANKKFLRNVTERTKKQIGGVVHERM